jgi:CheY-like chemotaxis protein
VIAHDTAEGCVLTRQWRDGHRVDRAHSGREALTHLSNGEVDLILSDLRMPDLDGPALYHELAAQRPDLLPRLVFMTGDTLGGDMTGFLTETGVRVLEKPLDPAGLGRRIQGFLAMRETADALTPGPPAATADGAAPPGKSGP